MADTNDPGPAAEGLWGLQCPPGFPARLASLPQTADCSEFVARSVGGRASQPSSPLSVCWCVWWGIPGGLRIGTTQEAGMKGSHGDILPCCWNRRKELASCLSPSAQCQIAPGCIQTAVSGVLLVVHKPLCLCFKGLRQYIPPQSGSLSGVSFSQGPESGLDVLVNFSSRHGSSGQLKSADPPEVTPSGKRSENA